MQNLIRACLAILIVLLQACSGSEPVSPERYIIPDEIVSGINSNIASAESLDLVADIDHSRLGHGAESPMKPSRVLIFSDVELETDLVQLNPLLALELPLRVLTYESNNESTKVIYNSFDYLVSRYGLDGADLPALRARYDEAIGTAIASVPEHAMASFEDDTMQPDGIITIASPYDYDLTISKIRAAIESQDDTMYFGSVDFKANAERVGIDIAPSYMILFGGPGPGGKAMANSPTLGLDGFCQKFLVWQDDQGLVRLSFNDLLALADRHGASKSLALRVINRRLKKTFSSALEAD